MKKEAKVDHEKLGNIYKNQKAYGKAIEEYKKAMEERFSPIVMKFTVEWYIYENQLKDGLIMI